MKNSKYTDSIELKRPEVKLLSMSHSQVMQTQLEINDTKHSCSYQMEVDTTRSNFVKNLSPKDSNCNTPIIIQFT